MTNNIPRRCRFDLMTPAELAISSAISQVEAMGADPSLTDAVTHLLAAREHIADYVDSHVKRVQYLPEDRLD